MTDPGSRAGFGPLVLALALGALAAGSVAVGWISATVIESAPADAGGCRAACACREASP